MIIRCPNHRLVFAMTQSFKCRYRANIDEHLLENCHNCANSDFCSSQGKTIFIVDDDVDQLIDYEEFFINSGYDCKIFKTVLSSLDGLSVFICDVLLSDIQIGDIDGLFLARFARTQNLADIIILNSGLNYGEKELPERTYFFMKPINLQKINDLILKNLA